MGSVLLIFFVICVVLFCVFTFLVTCCAVRYDFQIKTMFSSSLPPVVCRMAHYLRYLCLFVYNRDQHILCCVFLRLVCPMLSVSLDYPFFISPSVFST